MNFRIFFLIAVVLLIGSGNFMRSNFAYDSIVMSDNFNKIFQSEEWLDQYYKNPNNFIIKYKECKNFVTHTVDEVQKMMKNYYWADMVFALAYSILFLIIANRIRPQKRSIYKPYLFEIIIFVLFLCDVSENGIMICYFQNMSADNLRIVLLHWLNGIKTLLFAYCCFTLILLQIPFLYGKFKAWMTPPEPER